MQYYCPRENMHFYCNTSRHEYIIAVIISAVSIIIIIINSITVKIIIIIFVIVNIPIFIFATMW